MCEPATTTADLTSAENAPSAAYLYKDPLIVVHIARVLEGRSEGVETLHYISSAHVKESGKCRHYFKSKQKKIVPMVAE